MRERLEEPIDDDTTRAWIAEAEARMLEELADRYRRLIVDLAIYRALRGPLTH